MKRTILYDKHVSHQAKMVEFAGYLMPIEYKGLVEEHLAVRTSWGMFDCSHMGELLITGPDALGFVNYLVSNQVTKEANRMTYALLLDEDGLILDDLMCYTYNTESILLVVNAANKDKDLEWICSQQKDFNVVISDLSDSIGLLAVQGQDAVTHLQSMCREDITNMKMFDFKNVTITNLSFMISRSGYTGEDGFEIYGSNAQIVTLFDLLVEQGVTLCGLGCRDTLRFEASLPLYGHEISSETNPFEAGLSFAVDMTKEFIGARALQKVKEKGIARKLVGLELTGKGIARSGYKVFSGDQEIGTVTTGYLLPGESLPLALAMIEKDYWDSGTMVEVQIRKNKVEARVRNKRFLDKKYKK